MFWIAHCCFRERGDLVNANALFWIDRDQQLPWCPPCPVFTSKLAAHHPSWSLS
jgi:hypothetical protein